LNVSESGQVWREKLTGATGTLWLKPRTIFRVRAGAGTVVKIDGILAMTMIADEIAIFNCGEGIKSDNKSKVKVEILTTAAWVQISDDTAAGR
jgi:hypothetical protein